MTLAILDASPGKPHMNRARRKNSTPTTDTSPPRCPNDPVIATGTDDDDPIGYVIVDSFINGQQRRQRITLEQALVLDPLDVECQLDFVQGKHSFKKSTCERREHRESIPKIGVKRLEFLITLMERPLLRLKPKTLAKLAGIKSEYPGVPVAASVCTLRQYFFEEIGSQWFIVTCAPLSYGWNTRRSYRILRWESDVLQRENGNRCA